jgi:hypothetical protein
LFGAAQQHPVAAAVVVLAVLGVIAMWRGSRNKARRVAAQAREATRAVSLAERMLTTAAVITGVQWAVWSAPTGTAVRAVTLGLPALFAAHTLTHAVTVSGQSPHRGRR